MDTAEIQEKFPVFRVLLMGRGNAGKTTLLKRVCGTTDEPKIYNEEGEKLDPSILADSKTRGYHNINNVLKFKSNPRYRFHDSCGFEAGGRDEVNWIKEFIAERAAKRKTRDQLHAIWFCIPVDDSRLVMAAERDFFTGCKTGDVPVIVAFTKFDKLVTDAWEPPTDEGWTVEGAKIKALKQAIADFEKDQLHLVYSMPHPPKDHVYLQDMQEPMADCGQLIDRTAKALGSETLQQLLVSTQRNSLWLCARYALERVCMPEIVTQGALSLFAYKRTVKEEEVKRLYQKALAWFPHFVSLSDLCESV